jgi:uncharacterized membrane protein YdbT with pleckstrin-like domain
MPYYRKVLQPGEDVRFLGRLHWIIYGPALVGVASAALIAVAGLPFAEAHPEWRGAALIVEAAIALCILYVLVKLIGEAIRRVTTEIVVTDRRVLFKTGVFGRRTAEMNISKIETVDVFQGVIGRVLGFGTVLVRGTGSGLEPLARVADPIALRNAILAG